MSKKESYVPQDIVAELLEMLEEAGFGKPGHANTLWGMTRDAIKELKILRESALMACITPNENCTCSGCEYAEKRNNE